MSLKINMHFYESMSKCVRKIYLKNYFIHSIKKNMRNHEVFYEGIYSIKILFFFL